MKKIAYNLYRVSGKKQVHVTIDNREDIPMQRMACREFAERMDWVVGKEFEEKGVSGSKVSAENRDAIQDLKEAAQKGEFQVLLVFMFDRIGRIDDETPFVVEWFIKQGIEVWSVNEGEQKMEQHVDKLMNYIRFWQAAGESEKTSIRTKTRLAQIVQEGCFRGGTVPYGYRLEKQGRLNKNKHEVNEILVDEEESVIVRKIFDLYVTKGYGSQRISTYLREQGVFTRRGENFTNSSVANILKNKSYIGVLKCGEIISEIFPHLQIIDPNTYDAAQNILKQRSAEYLERCVPLNTRGNSLLSGNIFCGHCGGRLTLTTNGKKRTRKDGSVVVTPKVRYTCYNKSRHRAKCNGQTGYTAKKLDNIIETIVHGLFGQITDTPKDALITGQYDIAMAEYQSRLSVAQISLRSQIAEVAEYETEVIKIIRGESKLDPDLLNKLYSEAKEKAVQTEDTVRQLKDKINESKELMDSFSQQYEQIVSWADMFDGCDMETKKMILARIMSTVKVSRDYEIEITFTVGFEQFGGMARSGFVSGIGA
jgi:DNA invertase Pin-like site-specific DNA recombinase